MHTGNIPEFRLYRKLYELSQRKGDCGIDCSEEIRSKLVSAYNDKNFPTLSNTLLQFIIYYCKSNNINIEEMIVNSGETDDMQIEMDNVPDDLKLLLLQAVELSCSSKKKNS